MKIRVTSVDYSPQELQSQTPFEAVLLRKIPGSDGPDYWIAELTRPNRRIKDNQEIQVTHLVIAARWQGTEIGPGMRSMPLGIAYVADPSLLADSHVDMQKCAYVAIGAADEVSSA